jgi:hypothetical protein
MGIKIPGWLVSLLTFPGVILHEWAHKKFCDLAKVKVHEVVYFNLDFIGENEPAGYVIHERPTTYKQIFLISVGPLIINSLATILLGYLFQILGFNTPETQNSLLAIILAWLALSIGMHAFPSDEDMKHILEASKIELAKGGSKIHYLAFPFVWLISLANKLRAIWFDAIYAGLLMMLGISLASLNIYLILFVLLVIVILSFSFLFLFKSNLQSSIVKDDILAGSDREVLLKLIFPLFQEIAKSPDGKISSWDFFADLQINYINPQLNLYQFAQKYSEIMREKGIFYHPDDILSVIYAQHFAEIYSLSKAGILNFVLPEPNLDNIKDPKLRDLTEIWIESIYRGYKLVKMDPPPEIKILYNSLTKEIKGETQNVKIIEDIYRKNEQGTEDHNDINQTENKFIYCHKCHHENKRNNNFCTNCGQKLIKENYRK